MSFLILRNTSGKSFPRLELLVEADAGYIKYQDFITLINVEEIPLVVNLPRIPLQEIEFPGNNRIITTYNQVRIKIVIHDDSLSEHESQAESYLHPTYTEFFNSRWDKKWNFVWNLDFIESCKTDLRCSLHYYLITRNQWPVAGEPDSAFYRLQKALRLLIGPPLFHLLGNDGVISTLFWLPIFVRIKKLAPRESD